jgi:alpha-D-xyloside xylohydrolase
MAESLRGGLSLGLCGFGFWSHDIGGFEGLPPPGVYKRWVAFGLLSSHSRLHGSSSYRVPWNYNGEACDVLRFFTKLKCRLMPYLYGAAVEAHREGVPMMRAMVLEFPLDLACVALERQYMLGASLLVAPVFTEDGSVDYYLPEGRWTHLLSGEVQVGGRWYQVKHDFFSLPLFARAGSLVAFGRQDDKPDYAFTDGTLFRAYEIVDGTVATCSVPTLRGEAGLTLTVKRQGQQIEAALSGQSPGGWRLQLAGVKAVAGVEGGVLSSDPLGAIVTASSPETRMLRLTLV